MVFGKSTVVFGKSIMVFGKFRVVFGKFKVVFGGFRWFSAIKGARCIVDSGWIGDNVWIVDG